VWRSHHAVTRVPERSEERSALDAGAAGARRKASRRPGGANGCREMSQAGCDDRTMIDASDQCAMGDDCYYREGAGSFTEKDQKDDPAGDWDKSKDHYPELKSLDGTLLPGNMRLMHVHCNRVDYSNLVLEARLLTLTDADGRYLKDMAVDRAMESHLRLLDENEGRVPKGHKSLKFAIRIAREPNEGLNSGAEPVQETPLLDAWRTRSTDVFRVAAREFRMKGESPRAYPSTWSLWRRYVECESAPGARPKPGSERTG
jgi:hypothetical protein